MMYLVLTALLALNVSKEILNSFVLINDSLEITNDNFSSTRINLNIQPLKAEMNDPEKVGPFKRRGGCGKGGS